MYRDTYHGGGVLKHIGHLRISEAWKHLTGLVPKRLVPKAGPVRQARNKLSAAEDFITFHTI